MKIILAGKYEVPNPDERIRYYCESDIYAGYDDAHDINNTISRDNIAAANRLRARIASETTAYELCQSHDLQVALAKVEHEPLGNLSDVNWQKAQQAISQLFDCACSINGVRLPVATKVLHLKRPRLIPILDSQVMNLILERNIPSNKSRLSALGIEAMNVIRDDLIANRGTLAKLGQKLTDLPIPLENVRLYDILAWSYEHYSSMSL